MANMFSRIIRSILGNKISDDVIAKNQASDDADGKHYIDLALIEKTEFIHPKIRNFVCCGLMGWDLIRLVMPMAGIELQIAADVHSYPLPHDAA